MSGRGNLYENTKVKYGSSIVVASTVITTNRIDMSGFEGVMFIVQLSSKAANSSDFHFRAQGSTADSTASAVWYDTTISKSTARAKSSGAIYNYSLGVGDVYKPVHRYVRGQFYSTAAGNASTGDTRGCVLAILYGPRWADSTRYTGIKSTQVGLGGVIIGATS